MHCLVHAWVWEMLLSLRLCPRYSHPSAVADDAFRPLTTDRLTAALGGIQARYSAVYKSPPDDLSPGVSATSLTIARCGNRSQRRRLDHAPFITLLLYFVDGGIFRGIQRLLKSQRPLQTPGSDAITVLLVQPTRNCRWSKCAPHLGRLSPCQTRIHQQKIVLALQAHIVTGEVGTQAISRQI